VSLQWYRGEHCDVSDELNEIVKKKEESTKIEGFQEKLSLVFSLPFLKAFSTSGVLFFLAQFTGISALVMFMINIFQDTNSSVDPRLAPVMVGAVRILSSTCSSIALKKGNRKVMFCGSVFILSLSTLGLALLNMYRVEGEGQHVILGYLPIVLIFIMFMAHAFGVNGVIHVITGEVYPTSIRSLGYGLSQCMGSSGSALQSYLFALMSSLVGTSGCFLWFSVHSFLTVIYAYFVIPDNRGLSLVKIEREMMGKLEQKRQEKKLAAAASNA